jgi:hypothetical protein
MFPRNVGALAKYTRQEHGDQFTEIFYLIQNVHHNNKDQWQILIM